MLQSHPVWFCEVFVQPLSMTRIEYQTDVELHFATIPTDRKIDVATVHQLLGVGAHRNCNQCTRDNRSGAAAKKNIIRENS
jgi:hypothetical protein